MQKDVREFVAMVMRYWKKYGRHDLPWRHTSAYGVLVSEIMLQQTQVERVIPYFTRWMKKFPMPQKLAKAALQDVLKEWSGLGYNRRAKMLRECAKKIVEMHGGKVPKDFAALKALPGIGPYTAGAIRAFAFDEEEVFIETNIRAALIHHFFPQSKKVDDKALVSILKKCLAGIQENHLPKKKTHTITQPGRVELSYVEVGAREWYSALMDYGAHVKATHPNPSRRSKHHTKQSKFEGSLRQVRGAILKAKIQGESLRAVRAKYERYDEAYQSLLRDGLVESN